VGFHDRVHVRSLRNGEHATTTRSSASGWDPGVQRIFGQVVEGCLMTPEINNRA
jgi:hypothetical protein